MTLRILSLTAHSIEEADMLRLFTDLGYDMFSPGAYIDPSHPLDDMRPPMPDAPHHPELKAIIDVLPVTADRPDRLWNAKDDLPPELIDWAEVIMCHHAEWRWLWPQWPRIRHKRVIWRTVGQSSHANEWQAQPYAGDGLQIVRYSPREVNLPNYAGSDALIRFYKDPDEWTGWTGEAEHILIVTQNPTQRGDMGSWVNLEWIQAVTAGLEVRWVGPGTEPLGGLGKVPLDQLKAEMQQARCALYTGTQPASYTLALIEMMMTGTPVVSIGPDHMQVMKPYGTKLYEGHMLAPLWADGVADARAMLSELLTDIDYARRVSAVSRARAELLFAKDRIGARWQAFLAGETLQDDDDPEDWPDVATWGMTDAQASKGGYIAGDPIRRVRKGVA